MSDVRRLRSLDTERACLKRLLAAAMLENEATKASLRKNGNHIGPSDLSAVDADEGTVVTRSALGGTPCAISPDRIATRSCAHRSWNLRSIMPSIRRWDDLPEATSTWLVREL